MDRIPIEVLVLIFDRIPIDQLDECRLVCKRWHFTVENLMPFDCLVVYKECPPNNERFFHTNRRVSLRHCVNTVDPSKFKNHRSVYSKFKRIYHLDYLCHLPEFSSAWQRLEEVHLGSIRLPGNYQLTLSNLKVFQVCQVFDGILKLDTPQLSQLKVYYFNTSFFGNVALAHPETVETLQITGPRFDPDDCKVLATMSGLRSLVLEIYTSFQFNNHAGVLEPLLADLCVQGKLKEIHFWTIGLLELREGRNRAIDSVMRRLKQRAKEMRIYLAGVEFDHLRNLPDLLPKRGNRSLNTWWFNAWWLYQQKTMDAHLTDPSMLSDTLPFREVSYGLIEKHINSQIFQPRRLVYLRMVRLFHRVNDELALIRWLKGLETLTDIFVSVNCGLSRKFFSDTLPTICPNIKCFQIYIKASTNKGDRQPDEFSFLLKFKSLSSVHFHCFHCVQPDYSMVKPLFANLVHFRKLVFYKRKVQCKMFLNVVKSTNEFNVYFRVNENGQGTGRIFQSLDSLIQFTKQLSEGTLQSNSS